MAAVAFNENESLRAISMGTLDLKLPKRNQVFQANCLFECVAALYFRFA